MNDFRRLLVAKHSYWQEELFATWVATALLMSILGTNFAARVGITPDVRQTLDILFVTFALLVLLWAFLSWFQLISFVTHRFILCLLMLATIGVLTYVL